MTIPSSKYLKNKARTRLEAGKEPQKVVLYYSVIVAVMAFLVTAVRYGLAGEISQTGGLQNIGIRSILSTADNVLPIVQSLLVMCLDLGYLAAMLRIARHQYASPKTLKAGAERFWPLIRMRLLMGLLYIGLGFVLFYAALAVFTASPFSREFNLLANTMLSSGVLDPEALLANDVLMAQMYMAIMPMLIIWAVLYLPTVIWLSYKFRMADYILIDQPQAGARNALRFSKVLMKGNTWKLMKVDLSYWWYYVLRFLATFLLYADLILAIFGIYLPVSETVTFLGTVIVYLAADFALNYFLRNRVEVTYALAYTSIAPKEEKPEGAVLGNIFQM